MARDCTPELPPELPEPCLFAINSAIVVNIVAMPTQLALLILFANCNTQDDKTKVLDKFKFVATDSGSDSELYKYIYTWCYRYIYIYYIYKTRRPSCQQNGKQIKSDAFSLLLLLQTSPSFVSFSSLPSNTWENHDGFLLTHLHF